MKGALKDAVEHRASHASRQRVGVGILNLSGDFDFTDHLGLQTRDDREKMFDGLQPRNRAQMLVQHGRRRARRLKQRATHMQSSGFIADSVSLETIAGRE